MVMVRFDTRDEAVSFADISPEKYKRQLQLLKSMVFDSTAVYPILPNLDARYTSKVTFIPKKFKVMISIGDYVVYLVCDVVFNELTIDSVDDDNVNPMSVFDILYINRGIDIKRGATYTSYFKNEPKDLFNEFARMVSLDDVGLDIESVIINKK